MTSSQIPSRIAMPCPFGGFGSNNITPIKTVTGTDVNFPDGFPSAYGAPTDTSGKFVTRKEMNAIGNLASNDLFYHKCGGLNTFDAAFCAQIGGYPKGAVLKMLGDNNTVFDVISLVDNNTFDFTENGIDNEHWKYMNLNIGDPSLDDTVFQWAGTHSEGVIQIGTFVAPKTGTLRVSTTPNITKIGSEVIANPFPSSTGSNKFFNGIGIIVAPSSVTVTPDILITSSAIFAIGVRSLRFGVMTATLSSTPFRGSISIQDKQFTQYSLSKGIAYTVYIINSPECTTTGSYSGTEPTVYGNTYSLDGKLTILM